ncbi:MAG TPA: hypothetical protein VGL71_04570 [Urbifossiella sp.]|jgi:hypothetical protein
MPAISHRSPMNRSAFGFALAIAIGLTSGTASPAQDSTEVKALKERIATLESRLKLAERENELLKKELSLAKTDNGSPGSSSAKTAGKKTLSERLPVNTVLAGNETFEKTNGGGGLRITVTEREGNKIKASYVYEWTKRDGAGRITATGKVHRDLEGEITINQLAFKSVGLTSKVNISLSMNGDTLDGSVAHSDLGKGKVSLKIPK